jgi:hypothetical protein
MSKFPFDDDLSISLTRLGNMLTGNSNDEDEIKTEHRNVFEDCKYPSIADAVNEVLTSKDYVRSSSLLAKAMRDIVGQSVNEVRLILYEPT